MDRRQRRGIALAAMLAVLTTVGACGRAERRPDQAAETPVPGGTAVVAVADEPDVLNSLVRTSAVAGTVLSLIEASLIEMTPALLWEPQVAERWEVAPDSLSITYHLRPWCWEDGAPLTSADVRLSWQLLTDPRVGSPRADLLRDIADVTTPDSATVVYRFRQPPADPLTLTFHAIVPAHVVADLDPTRLDRWPTNRRPLASGPFRLDSWDAGSQLVLARNPACPQLQPYLDRVVLRVMPDETARILALEAGEVDVVSDVAPAAARRLADHPEIGLHEVSGRVFGFLMWNTRRPQLASPTVRKALSLAIDRGRFVDDLLGGYGEPAASYLPPVLWNHDRDLAPDPFRPDSARALLAAAGWRDGDGDGVRERDGLPLRIEIIYRSGDSVRENGAVVLRQNLRDVGVDVSLRALELGTALDFLRGGRFDAYWGEFQANLYADPSPLVQSGATDRFNFGGYANARVDSLLAAARACRDRGIARPLWDALQVELAADQPAAVIYYPRQIVAINRRLRDATPDMLSPVNYLHRWWIAPADRRWMSAQER
ncbi:MAG: ABC transporter substrate-binding protein [Candidatus Krumholzibacteriia bacterium]